MAPSLMCLGKGSLGQLADGTGASTKAVLDSVPHSFDPSLLAVGHDHFCIWQTTTYVGVRSNPSAVLDGKGVYCAGDNTHGQLGTDPPYDPYYVLHKTAHGLPG